MKRLRWLVSLTAAVAVLTAGCGGAAQSPTADAPGSSAVAPAGTPEIGGAISLQFEVIEESMLPAQLSGWKELTQPPATTQSARVGEYLYVLVTGGKESIGASAILPIRVDLVESPAPMVTVTAEITSGKSGAEIMTFPKSYLRIPYSSPRPVPGVQTSLRLDSAGTMTEPVKVAKPPVDPSTPVSSPAKGSEPAPVPVPPATSPGGGTVLDMKVLPESALPDSLARWKVSTVQVPNGVAQYVDGALYLMVSGGQQSSGGYAVEIRSARMEEGKLLVSASLQRPKPGQMVTMAVTYPKAFAKIDLVGSGEPQVIVNWE